MRQSRQLKAKAAQLVHSRRVPPALPDRPRPTRPPGGFQGLRPLLRTPERRLSILEACGGPQEPASGRPPRPKVEGLSPFIFQPPRTRRLGWLPELLAFEERMPPQSRELLRAAVEAQGVRRA